MKSIPFTQNQMNLLYQNPYTAKVTSNTISFTLEFKIFALNEAQAGTSSVKIFIKAGYDPEILGKQRIYSAIKKIKKQAASPRGLQPPRGMTKEKRAEQFAKAELSNMKTATAIDELQNKVIALEEKIEFLSKLFF